MPLSLSSFLAYAEQETISPTQIDTLHIEALRLKNEGRYSEAETIFKRILTVEPENANAHFDLGNTYLIQKKYNEALNHYKEAKTLGLDGGMDSYYFNLSLCYVGLGNNKEAIVYLEKCISLNPAYPDIKSLLELIKEAYKNGDKLEINPMHYQEQDKNVPTGKEILGKIYESLTLEEKQQVLKDFGSKEAFIEWMPPTEILERAKRAEK